MGSKRYNVLCGCMFWVNMVTYDNIHVLNKSG
jgi:hypothetical protein